MEGTNQISEAKELNPLQHNDYLGTLMDYKVKQEDDQRNVAERKMSQVDNICFMAINDDEVSGLNPKLSCNELMNACEEMYNGFAKLILKNCIFKRKLIILSLKLNP